MSHQCMEVKVSNIGSTKNSNRVQRKALGLLKESLFLPSLDTACIAGIYVVRTD